MFFSIKNSVSFLGETKLLSFLGAFCFGITLKTLQVGAGKMSVYYGAGCLKAAIGNEE